MSPTTTTVIYDKPKGGGPSDFVVIDGQRFNRGAETEVDAATAKALLAREDFAFKRPEKTEEPDSKS